MNVAKGRHFKTLLPYQMKQTETVGHGHLSTFIILITSMSESLTSSLIISCSNH